MQILLMLLYSAFCNFIQKSAKEKLMKAITTDSWIKYI